MLSRLSLVFFITTFIWTHELVNAQSATTPPVVTSSLIIPSDAPTTSPPTHILAAGVKGNGQNGNNDNDQADDGEDPSGDTNADPDSDNFDASSSLTSSTSSTPTSSITGSVSTAKKPQSVITNEAVTSPHSHTAHSFPTQSTHFSFHPHPIPTSGLDGPSPPSHTPTPSSHHDDHSVAIALAVIGGISILILLLCCGRCMYKYRRLPARDRISMILDRHRLERELEEMEEARRTSLTRPPPPAYQNAPSYDEAVSEDGRTINTENSGSVHSQREEHHQQPP